MNFFEYYCTKLYTYNSTHNIKRIQQHFCFGSTAWSLLTFVLHKDCNKFSLFSTQKKVQENIVCCL